MRNYDLRYCLSCERICVVLDTNITWHFADVKDGDEPVECYGPFTTSTPPEIPENWVDFVVEPSEDELIEMDMNAEVLLAELEM